MAFRQCALVAALIPAIAFAAYVPGTNTTWNASNAAALLLANQGLIVPGIDTQAGTAANGSLAGLVMTGLTCVASGPAASGKFVLSMTSSTAALADQKFPRWIAKAFAIIMACHESQVDVSLTAVRRLSTDDRRLAGTTTVNGAFNVFNPNRGRNIGLGIGLGLIAPAIGLGVGLPLGLNRKSTTPIPATPAPLPPVPVTTPVPEEGSSMPLWAGILLALAILACIGAAIFAATSQGKKKKKAPKKKAAPVREEIRVIEEVVPMMQQPVQYIQQPVQQSVQYIQEQPVQYIQQPVQQSVQYIQEQPVQYIQQQVQQPTFYQSVAAPTYQQTYQPVGGSVRMF